jgi:hypothetical protein
MLICAPNIWVILSVAGPERRAQSDEKQSRNYVALVSRPGSQQARLWLAGVETTVAGASRPTHRHAADLDPSTALRAGSAWTAGLEASATFSTSTERTRCNGHENRVYHNTV